MEPLLNRLTVEGRRVISVFTDLKGVRKKELKMKRQKQVIHKCTRVGLSRR